MMRLRNPTAEALKILSQNEPPKEEGRLPYQTYSTALDRVNELRASLGIVEPESKIFNVVKLNRRIAELETALAQREGANTEKSIFDRTMPEIIERCAIL